MLTDAIITVSNKDKLHVAFHKLIEGHVYSLPVMDTATGKFLGLLSLSAVVSRLVHLFGERCAGLAHLSSHEFSQKDIADIAYQFQNLDISPDLLNKVTPLKPGINIQEAIDFFVGPGNDSSQVRLPIVDENGEICNLVSPTMILKFLSEHMEELPEKLVNRRISSIPGVISPSVKTCRSTDRTIDALAQMVMLQFSALGIEDVDSPHRHIVSIVTMKVRTNSSSSSFFLLIFFFFFFFQGRWSCNERLWPPAYAG